MARGSGIMKFKLKNLTDGHSMNHTCNSDQLLELAEYTTRKGQYLYSDSDNHYFMDADSYEQFTYPISANPNLENYLIEGSEIDLNITGSRLLSVELPIKIKLKVIESPPNEKGDTASGATKQVTLETGLKINVPLFMGEGDIIVVNTTTNQYIERAK